MTEDASVVRARRAPADWLALATLPFQGGPERTFRVFAWLVIAAVSASCLFLQLPTHQWFSDYWEHASAIRALAANLVNPANPHYASLDPDRQFIPPFVILALAVRYLGMSVFAVLGLFGVFTTGLLVFSIGRFARVFFSDLWAPCAALLVLLFTWGQPWVWTGCYELRALFYNAYYPATFVFALTFAAWTIVIRALRCGEVSAGALIGLGALTAVMFVTHQLGAVFALGGIALFLLFEPLASMRVRGLIALAVLGGVAVTWFWPYFNPIRLMLSASSDPTNEGHADFYSPGRVLLLLGPSLLGLYGMTRMVRRTGRLSVVLGFATILAGYLIGGLAGNPITHRLLTYFIVFLHLGIVWEILERQKGRAGTSQSNRRLLLAGLAWIVVQIGFAGVDFLRFGIETVAHRSFGAFPNHPVVAIMETIAANLPDGAVVFASDGPALVVPTFRGKTVARPRPELMIADGRERAADNARFFSRNATPEERADLIRKYGATHIVYRALDIPTEVAAALEVHGAVAARAGDLVLIALAPNR